MRHDLPSIASCIRFVYVFFTSGIFIISCTTISTDDMLSGKFSEGPIITGLQSTAYNQVEVRFSMTMDPKSASLISNFKISGLSVAKVSISPSRGDSIIIETGVQKSQQVYTLTTQNLFSASGIAGRMETRSFAGFNSVGTSVLVDRGNGTVFESSKNLIWMKCTLGQQYNAANNDCTGTGNAGNDYGATAYTFCNEQDNDCNGGISGGILGTPFLNNGISQLFNACNTANSNPVGGYAGITGWRVPTISELLIILKSDQNPHIDTGRFPQNSTTYYYASASSDPGNAQRAYDIDFSGGTVNNNTKTFGSVVRCVSPN